MFRCYKYHFVGLTVELQYGQLWLAVVQLIEKLIFAFIIVEHLTVSFQSLAVNHGISIVNQKAPVTTLLSRIHLDSRGNHPIQLGVLKLHVCGAFLIPKHPIYSHINAIK